MGKRSRLKAARSIVSSAFSPAQIPAGNGFVIGMATPSQHHLLEQYALDLHNEAHTERHNERIERLNNTPLGHPENKWKMDRTFAPVEHWIANWTKTGEYEVLSETGEAIIRPEAEEEAYPVGDAFKAICETYTLIANDRGIPDEGGGLRTLAEKIEAKAQCFWHDIEAAQASLEWMKSVTRNVTPVEFSQFTQAVQARAIMVEMGLL